MRRTSSDYMAVKKPYRFRTLCTGMLLVGMSVAPRGCVSPAVAETLNISGLTFTVDSVSPIDDETSKVTIHGSSAVVKQSEVDDYIAREVLEDPKQSEAFSTESLQNFVIQSLQADKITRASTAFPILIGRAVKLHDTSFRTFVDVLAKRRNALPLLKVTLGSWTSDDAEPQVLCPLISAVGSGDVAWLQSRAESLLKRGKEVCRDYFTDEVKSAFQAGNVASAHERLILYSELFGKGEETFKRLTSLVSRGAQILEELKRSGDLTVASALLQADSELADALAPALNREINERATQQLDSGDVAGALKLVEQTDFTRRTPFTHQVIIRTLGLIGEFLGSKPLAEVPVPFEPSQLHMLEQYGAKDPEIRKAFEELMMKAFAVSLDSGERVRASQILGQYVKLHPDPNSSNDELRGRLALAFLQDGDHTSARLALDGVRTSVPIGTRLRLLFGGLYFPAWIFIVVIVVPLVVVVPALITLPKRKARPVKTSRNPEEMRFDDDMRRRFVTLTSGKMWSYDRDEYLRCLRVFRLEPGVDVGSIKAAYRNAVKECHPDLKKNPSPEESQRFIELTATYEKLLDLHKDASKATE